MNEPKATNYMLKREERKEDGFSNDCFFQAVSSRDAAPTAVIGTSLLSPALRVSREPPSLLTVTESN
jgi:hypothetical protein